MVERYNELDRAKWHSLQISDYIEYLATQILDWNKILNYQLGK